MNTIILKYQLILLSIIIAITFGMVVAINTQKAKATSTGFNQHISLLKSPLNRRWENQKTEALLQNQSLFQSVITPKKALTLNNSEQKEAQSIPVLLYHGVTEKPDNQNVTIDQFRAQLVTLKKEGYKTITLEQLTKFNKGEIALPEKSFLLTFDDGRKDSFYNVDPILEALDYNAVIYIITKHSVGNKKSNYYLSEQELKNIQKTNRWEIDSHSKNGHDEITISEDGKKGSFFGNKMWLTSEKRLETDQEFINRIKDDLSTSQLEIEKTLKKKSHAIALPFGEYGQNSINFPEAEKIVKEYATQYYDLVMYQIWSDSLYYESIFNYPDGENRMIKRISIKADWSAQNVLDILTAHQGKTLPFSDSFKENKGWIKNWGEMSLENKALFTGSNDSANGSMVFLDGGLNWQNYSVKAFIDWLGGEDVTIIARFKDAKNYASCRIGDGQATIVETIDGEDTVLVKNNYDFPLQLYGATFELKVSGTNISCFAEGQQVATSDVLSPILDTGSIGFATWDRNPHNSAILVKYVSVEEIR